MDHCLISGVQFGERRVECAGYAAKARWNRGVSRSGTLAGRTLRSNKKSTRHTLSMETRGRRQMDPVRADSNCVV